MHNEDILKTPKDIEIRFHRLIYPSLNQLNIPLNGLYNPIDNIESKEYPLFNKFKYFDISSNKCVNIENLFGINNRFGKIYINQEFNGLLILINTSDNEIIIKDLKITLRKEDKKVNTPEKTLDINFPNNYATLPPKKGYTVEIKNKLKYESKYKINIYFHIRSFYYDQLYYKKKQRNTIKENAENYSIINGSVEFFIHKKLAFEVCTPFKVNEIYHNYSNNKCIIEIRIYNYTINPLTILDIFLNPKENQNIKIPLVQNLEDIKCNKYNNINDSKYLTIQTDEEIIVLFKIEDNDLFSDESTFVLTIAWLEFFDFNKKFYTYEFNNKLNTYNEYYKMSLVEKPSGDIILNQNFKIIINLKSKKTDKEYIITIGIEPNKNNNNNLSNNGEIEIIDIIEKKIKLNSNISSNNFVLICKSDILGNVNLPKLKISLYEEGKNIPVENIYDKLISFNCISKI